jgi:NADH-quinone oxidoreductase subunit L
VTLLWLVPALPLLGALILAIFGGLMPKRAAGVIGCLSVGLAWIFGLAVAAAYHASPPPEWAFRQTLFQWIDVASLRVPMGLYLDPLSLVMMLVVTFVGFIIHLYSAGYMFREDGYSRFFCYMNLFVASMLILVLGDNLVSLYLGWEGVGLCSYLLIGFWYRVAANGRAAQKAFIVTRVGDTSLAIAFFVLFWRFGTLDIQQAMNGVSAAGAGIVVTATIAGLLVLGGAVGKSAQVPLQTWLPDAMAGPTPVSALIHAATMVTAGVYLIARTHVLFSATRTGMLIVAIVGAATALYAACSALTQRDIKRVLAYSTISQIGYMFLALGVGAYWAAIFHFMTHAFFKALLFLSAGIVVQGLGEERDIHRMGGLWRKLPTAGWTFLIGALSLSALPLVTAGFYSKDAILWASWASPLGRPALWAAGIVAAGLTGMYIFRVFFIAFLGPEGKPVERRPGFLVNLAVIVLSFFAVTAGFIGIPAVLGGFNPFEQFMTHIFGRPAIASAAPAAVFLIISGLVSIIGIALGYLFFLRLRDWMPAIIRTRAYAAARGFLSAGWGFDWLYDRLLVRPYVFLTALNRSDFIDWFYTGLALGVGGSSRAMSATQSGRLRNYATALLLGAVLVVGVLVWLR